MSDLFNNHTISCPNIASLNQIAEPPNSVLYSMHPPPRALNQILHPGPKFQDDLFAVLIRSRMQIFVFTIDIQKMFRQIIMDVSNQRFQLILRRNNSGKTLK